MNFNTHQAGKELLARGFGEGQRTGSWRKAAENGYALSVGSRGSASVGQLAKSVTTESATFELWIQTTNHATQGIFLLSADSGQEAPFISLADNRIIVEWDGMTFASENARPVSDGQWHHLAIVFDRGTLTIYKDGLQTADAFAVAPGTSLASGSGPQIACSQGATGTFVGSLYDIRLWSVARNQAQIQAYMYLQLTGREAGLSLLCNFPSAAVGNQVNSTTGELAGTAAVVQMPLPQQPPPITVWTYTVFARDPKTCGPVLTTGALIQGLTGSDNAGIPSGQVYSLDLQSNQPNWIYDSLENTPPDQDFQQSTQLGALTVFGQVAYAGISLGNFYNGTLESEFGGIHAIDLATGQKLWSYQIPYGDGGNSLASPITVHDGRIFFAWAANVFDEYTEFSGGYVALDLAGNETDFFYSVPYLSKNNQHLVGFTAAAFCDDIAVFGVNDNDVGATSGTLQAVMTSEGQPLWSFNIGSSMDAAPVIVNGIIYVGSSAGTLYAIDLSGQQVWAFQAGGEICTSPVVQGGSIFIANTSGTFFAVDEATGTLQWEFATGNTIDTDILIQDGVAYFAATGPSAPVLYAIDLATAGADVITYTPELDDTILFSNAGANGVVYFYGLANIYAVNMENILHEFQVDTKLIVENYDTSTSPPTPTDTSYRITITLCDPNKTPRAYQGVKLWAEDTLSLTCAGQTFTIGPSSPVWLETNGLGQVTFAVDALDSTGTPYVTLPAIKAWCNFMQVQEAIVIYPDHENLASLATVQGNTPSDSAEAGAGADNVLYLDQAKGYDGQPLIIGQYQQPPALNAIAQVITNTIGLRPNAAAGVGTPTKYLAYPRTMLNVVYQPDSSQPTGRTYVSGASPHWTSAFDPATGELSFQSLTPAEAESMIQQILGSGSPNLAGSTSGGIFTGIEDFFSHVVQGAEKIALTVWHALEHGIEVLIKTTENLYHLVIDTIEHAVIVVVGFLKRVVTDIVKVIQWLSWLFDWPAFVATHNQFKQTVQTNIGALKNWIDTQLQNEVADITKVIEAAKSDVDGAFSQIISAVQGQSLGNLRARHNNTQQIYTQGGKNYQGPCLWLHQKTQENLNSAGKGPASMPYILGKAKTGPDSLGDMGDVIVAAFEGFLKSVAATIAQEFSAVPNELLDFGRNFGNLFSSPKTFLENALADLLKLIQTVADSLLDIAEAIVDAFLTMLKTIVDALLEYVTNPPAVSIPFVSDLYRAITGQPLSWFDLVAMIVAIPATIMFKVFTALDSSPTADADAFGAVPQILDWGNFFIMVCAGIVDPIADASDNFPGLSILDFILSIYGQGISGMLIQWPFDTWQGPDYCYWALQWIPVVFSGYGLYLSKSPSEWGKDWGELQPALTGIFGIFIGVITAVQTSADWKRYGGLTLAENLCSPVIYNGIEFLKYGEGEIMATMEVIKAVLAESDAIMNLVAVLAASESPDSGRRWCLNNLELA